MAATWDVDGAIVPIDAKPATDVQGSLQLLVPWQYQGPKLGGRRTGPCYSADPRSIALWACGRRVIAGPMGNSCPGHLQWQRGIGSFRDGAPSLS